MLRQIHQPPADITHLHTSYIYRCVICHPNSGNARQGYLLHLLGHIHILMLMKVEVELSAADIYNIESFDQKKIILSRVTYYH